MRASQSLKAVFKTITYKKIKTYAVIYVDIWISIC